MKKENAEISRILGFGGGGAKPAKLGKFHYMVQKSLCLLQLEGPQGVSRIIWGFGKFEWLNLEERHRKRRQNILNKKNRESKFTNLVKK